MKQEWNNPELVKGLPLEFMSFMDHVQSLDFNEKPDYDYLKSLLLTALTAQGGSESTYFRTLVFVSCFRPFFWETVQPPLRLRSLVHQTPARTTSFSSSRGGSVAGTNSRTGSAGSTPTSPRAHQNESTSSISAPLGEKHAAPRVMLVHTRSGDLTGGGSLAMITVSFT